MVVGAPPDAGVGLVLAVAVVPGVLPAVTVEVAVAVPPNGVTTIGACRSRKTMNGLLHQWSFASATCVEVGLRLTVGVVVPPPPPTFNPEQDTRKKLDNSRHVDTSSPAYRQCATNGKDRGKNIRKLLNNSTDAHG